MSRALIGHTGFVGSNLLRQSEFDDLFHSANIEAIRGRSYDLVVCAGAPAVKWKANQEPEADLANLERLMSCLAQVKAAHVILISTVDVYPEPIGVDEESPIDPDAGGAYGSHRLRLEHFVRERFDATIIRLPGLFGPGLKKNVIYDFLHDNRLDQIHPAAAFQFYPLVQLWEHTGLARRNGLALVNFATEPVSVREVARRGFGIEFENPAASGAAPRYDMRSRHAELFGGRGGYLLDADQVLDAIAAYAASEGWVRP